ncbi:MAG: hypothetical protein WCS52_07635 [bacterium]
MELIPIECGNCKAKLKIKAMPARMPTEVKCPKCGKPIPVGKGIPAAAAPAHTPAAIPAPTPSVSTQVAPPPPQPVAPAPAAPIASASSTAQLTPPPKPMQPSGAPQPVSSAKKAGAPIVLGQVSDSSSGANISVVCPSCQWQTKVSQTLIGKKIKCKQCSGIIPVNSPEQPKIEEEIVAPEAVTVTEPAIPVVLEAPAPPFPTPEPIAEPVITRLRPEPVEPVIPVAKWTEPEVILNGPLASSRVSPGTTVILGEISSLKSRLETATRESALSIKRAEEADTRVRNADARVRDADAKVQYAELRVKEAERTLHELAGKSAIDAMTANRRISELEAKLAPLEAKIAALNQSLSAVTDEFASELEHAEKTAARLKALLASHHSLRSS